MDFDDRLEVLGLLVVDDMEKAKSFYEAAFGLDVELYRENDNAPAFHGEARRNGKSLFMIGPAGPNEYGLGDTPATAGTAPPFNMYLYVEDVDAQYKTACAAGAEGTQAPKDEFWGDRTAMVRDPFGHLWMLATPGSGEEG